MSSVKRSRPNRPALWITPDISADTCAGAAACARGSQVWNGKYADFSANAIASSANTALRRPLGWRRNPTHDAKSIESDWPCMSMNALTSTNRPTCVETR